MSVKAVSVKTMRQQFADTMLSVGTEDSNLAVLIGDISHFILQPFAKACPGRFYNVGICEPTIVSMAAGMAKAGFYPVVHTIAPFILDRSFEQIKLDFCYQQLGGNLVTVGGVFDYSNLGCTHHCYGDFALLKTLARTEATYPASPVEFDELFRQTYRDEMLTLFRLPQHQHGVEFARADIQFGRAIKVRDGENLTIVATGPHLRDALEAADRLIGLGWKPEIIYVHTIRPLDVDLIRSSVLKTKRVLVIEEHAQTGGLGDDVLRVTADILGSKLASICIPDAFVTEYGTYEEHCAKLGMNSDGVVAKVQSVFGSH